MLAAILSLALCAHASSGPRGPKAVPPLGPSPVAMAPVRDETRALKALQQSVRERRAAPLTPEARVHRFLFAPGFSWDAVPNYFEPNIERLRALDLDAQLVPTDPLGTPEANGRALAAAIKSDPRPVVLIAHSKGGLDAIVGLQNDPEARKQVKKLVTIQTPYGGTPIADWFRTRPWLLASSLAYLRLLNPLRFWATSPFFRHETMEQLSTRARAEARTRAPFPDGGPEVFAIGSRVTADTSIRLALWLGAGTTKKLSGLDNDGIVAPEETRIPGSRSATLEHVGHIDTVSDPSSWKHKRLGVRAHDPTFAADLTEAVVRWVFTGSRAARRRSG